MELNNFLFYYFGLSKLDLKIKKLDFTIKICFINYVASSQISVTRNFNLSFWVGFNIHFPARKMVVSKFVYTFLDPFSSLFHAVFFVPTPESGEEHCIRVFFSFFLLFFVFHAKPGTKNNHWNWSSVVS